MLRYAMLKNIMCTTSNILIYFALVYRRMYSTYRNIEEIEMESNVIQLWFQQWLFYIWQLKFFIYFESGLNVKNTDSVVKLVDRGYRCS